MELVARAAPGAVVLLGCALALSVAGAPAGVAGEVVPIPLLRVAVVPIDAPVGAWVVGVVRLRIPPYDLSELACVERAGGHHLVGNVKFAEGAVAYVSTRVPPPIGEDCSPSSRRPHDIERTIAHESHHIAKYKAVLEGYQRARRGPFTSRACAIAMANLAAGLARDFALEKERQQCHRDPTYAGEPQRVNYCDGEHAAERDGRADVYPNC